MNIVTHNPTILGIETATSACSVALLHNNEVSQMHKVGNNIHSSVLLSMVDSLLSEAGLMPSGLDAVAVGQGPGSFTGLRIGVGVGQGIAFGADCPMIGVSSLEILAQSLLPVEQSVTVLAGIDARMGEVYWAEFSVMGNDITSSGELHVTAPQNICTDANSCRLVGNAWSEYWDQLSDDLRQKRQAYDEIDYPNASDLLILAANKYAHNEMVNASDFAPVYVRNNVAIKSTKPLPGKRV